MAELEISGVRKVFEDETEALKGIDLSIADGEFLILVGPSGCGKSTLLNSIAGLEEISEGHILIDGEDVSQKAPKDRDMAMVFQNYALYPSMNVRGNLSFGLKMRKVPKEEIAKEVDRVAQLLKIDQLLDRKPDGISGGQRQRVAMGRALARKPKIYLFDEPLSNLDAKLRVEMRTEIKKLHQDLGTTIVYVTHDQIEAMTLADRIAVMKDGLVQQFGTPQEVYDEPANIFVAGFMGSPSMNFIPTKIAKEGEGYVATLITGDNETFNLNLGERGQVLSRYVGKEVILGIRPERIRDIDHSQHKDNHLKTHAGVVEPTGPDTLVQIEINHTPVSCRVDPDYEVSTGQLIDIAMDFTKAVFFDADTEQRIV